MGRQNPEWYQELTVNISVQAADQEEALKRFADVRDALQARFNGLDIYPPRLRGQKGVARIAGNPRFLDFVLPDKPPISVVPFSDEFDEGTRRRSPLGETSMDDRQVLQTVVRAVARMIEKGLIPEDDELEALAQELRSYIANHPVEGE